MPDLSAPPILWTHEDESRRVSREFPDLPYRTYRRDEGKPWTTYSSTAALMLAGELGATRIDCYGVDMGESGRGSTTHNWDGSAEPTADRTESRWERERRAWSALADILAGRGVEVVRHTV